MVGIPLTPYFVGVFGSSSMLCLAIVTSLLISSDISSKIGPSLEEISDEMKDKITVAKINIDENPVSPTKYGVRGIPTMLVFKNGEAAAQKVGAVSKPAIVEWIEDSLA